MLKKNDFYILNNWIYVYYIQNDLLIYDRTLSRTGLGLSRAKEIVLQWEGRGGNYVFWRNIWIRKNNMNKYVANSYSYHSQSDYVVYDKKKDKKN